MKTTGAWNSSKGKKKKLSSWDWHSLCEVCRWCHVAAAAACGSAQHRTCSQCPGSGWWRGWRRRSGDVRQHKGKHGWEVHVLYIWKKNAKDFILMFRPLCRPCRWFSSRGRRDFSLVPRWFWTPPSQLIISSIAVQQGLTMCYCRKVGIRKNQSQTEMCKNLTKHMLTLHFVKL